LPPSPLSQRRERGNKKGEQETPLSLGRGVGGEVKQI